MNAQDLRSRLDLEHITALNELVHAVERVKLPEPIEIPDPDPDSIECIGKETRTHEELIAVGLEWQVLAGKLHDLLSELGNGDTGEVIRDLQARAEDARQALITLGGYQPPLPARPGL